VIAEIGHYAIVLALMLSVVQGKLPLIGAYRNDSTLMGVAVPAARGQFLFGLMVAVFGRNLPAGLRARVRAIQGLIGIGFLAFLLYTSNPFLRLDRAPF